MLLLTLFLTPLFFFIFLIVLTLIASWTFGKLHIIWDLDQTLIISYLLSDEEGLKKWPLKKYPNYFIHIDDDFKYENEESPNTRTYYRPFAKFVLWILSFFTIQYVFTSGQKSYMNNILRELDYTYTKKKDKKKYYNIEYDEKYSRLFKRVVSRDEFERKYLPNNGKDVLYIMKDRKFLKRTILVDDQDRYLKPHKKNGLLVERYKDISKRDWELLKVLGLIWISNFFRDIRKFRVMGVKKVEEKKE